MKVHSALCLCCGGLWGVRLAKHVLGCIVAFDILPRSERECSAASDVRSLWEYVDRYEHRNSAASVMFNAWIPKSNRIIDFASKGIAGTRYERGAMQTIVDWSLLSVFCPNLDSHNDMDFGRFQDQICRSTTKMQYPGENAAHKCERWERDMQKEIHAIVCRMNISNNSGWCY